MSQIDYLIEKIPAFSRFANKELNELQESNTDKIYTQIVSKAEYDKKAVRSKYRQIRNSIPEEKRHKSSDRIMSDIINSSIYINSKLIFIYISYLSEVETSSLIQHSLSVGKRVCVPKTLDNHIMLANEIFPDSEFTLDKYGIKVPAKDNIVEKSEIDLTIVPGLAFDYLGFRLGYGGGYYDKFLSDYTGRTIGVTYQQCVCDELIPDAYDIPVDMVIFH